MRNIVSLLFPALFCFTLFAQPEPAIWYFGNNAGIDFNSGTPTPLLNSPMSTNEGTATVCDDNGNLLFFTNGIEVWNANLSLMPNGTGLLGGNLGDPSTTQAAMIIKKPGSSTEYYLFTADQQAGPDGVRYSVVDMTLQGGLGDVTATKNVLLFAPTSEKLTAVRHSNGVDVWVIGHELSTNIFHAYPVTAAGVGTAVSSAVGAPHNGNAIGYMKANRAGDKLAVTYYAPSVELFDFDNSTGIVSNPRALNSVNFTYGLCFSPNGNLLYTAEILQSAGTNTIYQFDITSGNAATINSTRTIVGSSTAWVGSMEVAPDGKMYVARPGELNLGVINNPDVIGTGCNYVDGAFNLGGRMSQLGLPNFMYDSQISYSFAWTGDCSADSIHFTVPITSGIDSVAWDFDDPASGTGNHSSDLEPAHVFTTSGTYDVELTIYSGGSTQTISNPVTIDLSPSVELGGADTGYCQGSSLTLFATYNTSSVTWQDGSTFPYHDVTGPGIYWAEVSNSCGTVRDSITVAPFPQPEVNLGEDTVVCEQTTIILDAGNPGATYLWNNGSTNQTLPVGATGIYYVEVTSPDGCVETDTIQVNFFLTLNVDLGPDTTILQGETLVLDAGFAGAAYEWSTGDTTQTITVDSAGIYSVIVYDKSGCPSSDNITVNVISGIEDGGLADFIAVFPNPVSDVIYMEFTLPNAAVATIELMDAWGRTVVSKQQQNILAGTINKQLAVGDLPAGAYWLKIEMEGKVFARELVKL